MKKIAMAAALLGAFVLGNVANMSSASAAYGYCFQPSAPTAFLSKPTKPFCAASRSCSEWEVSSYRNEVDSYLRNLRNYADDVDRYYSEAAEYVRCMSDLD